MNTNHSEINWLQKKHQTQDKWIEYKTFELEVITCRFCFYLFILSVVLNDIKHYITLYYSKILNRKALDISDFFKYLTIKSSLYDVSCNIGKYFPCFSYFATIFLFCYLKASEISCKKRETSKILTMFHSAPCDNNYITVKYLQVPMWHFCCSFLFYVEWNPFFSITVGINTLKHVFKLFFIQMWQREEVVLIIMI